MQTSMDKIKDLILSIKDLPTLPTVAMEVMALTQDPDSSMADIVTVVQNDPAITTKILRIANSAFYGMRQKIDSINRALVVLGMNEVNNLITSISVFKTFPITSDSPSFDREKFWEHCALTGEIAKNISVKLGMKIMSEVFTAGLLHDVGKIIMDQYFHDDFNKALEISFSQNIPLYEAEKQVFGVNHSQIGGWVAEKWKLPRNLTDSILYHHKPERSMNYKLLTAIVDVANTFAKIADFSFSGERVQVIIEETAAWQIIKAEIPAVSNIDLAKFTFELEDMALNAKDFISIVK